MFAEHHHTSKYTQIPNSEPPRVAHLSADEALDGVGEHDGERKQEAGRVHQVVVMAVILQDVT